ncbi:MAG: winged helix-turn-helix domain-containing protein [Oceanicaulis sp.]
MSASNFTVGDFDVTPSRNQLTRGEAVVSVEPKVMDLLVFLASRPGETISRETLAEALWPGVIVNEDALSRTIFKLRKALGDDAKAPRYVETIPKRGVRLVAAVERGQNTEETPPDPVGFPRVDLSPRRGFTLLAGVIFVGIIVAVGVYSFTRQPSIVESAETASAAGTEALLARADGFYMQFTRADNEAALALYEQALAEDPANAAAMAGLANALTQRAIRFGGPDGLTAERGSLGEALASGWLDTEEARASIDRAAALAKAATEIAPGHARAWRALGLAESARRDFEAGRRAHERALVIAPDDWGALVNLADLAQLTGRDAEALAYMSRAFEAMERGFAEDPVAIRTWQSEIGLWVANAHLDAGADERAELWFRRVLAIDPVNVDAASRLAGLLRDGGDRAGADALCAELERRAGRGCD